MEGYFEQSVAAHVSGKKRMLYVMCWVLIVLLIILALFFAVGAFDDTNGEFKIHWVNAILLILSLAAAGFAHVHKDYLRVEYDYILKGKQLEVWAILNRRRRRRMLSIDLNRITACGLSPWENRGGATKIHKWYILNGKYYLCYMEGNVRHTALLEMDDEFAAHVRRHLPAGVWRTEGKKSNASLS